MAPPGTAGILPASACRQDAGGPRGYASLQRNLSEKTLAVRARCDRFRSAHQSACLGEELLGGERHVHGLAVDPVRLDAGRPVHLEQVSNRVGEVEAEGEAVVERERDGDTAARDLAVGLPQSASEPTFRATCAKRPSWKKAISWFSSSGRLLTKAAAPPGSSGRRPHCRRRSSRD